MGDSSGSLGAACEEEPGAEGGLRGGAVPLHKQVRNPCMPMPCRWGCVHGEVLEAHSAFVQVREQSSGRTPAPPPIILIGAKRITWARGVNAPAHRHHKFSLVY